MQFAEDNRFIQTLPDDVIASIYEEIAKSNNEGEDTFVPPSDPVVQSVLANADTFNKEQERFYDAIRLQAASTNSSSTHQVTTRSPPFLEQANQVINDISKKLAELRNVMSMKILDATSLHKLRSLINSLEMLRTCWNMIACQRQPGAAPAVLLLIEQPLPQVVFKGKVMDPYTVKLVTLPEWNDDACVTTKMNALLCVNIDLLAGGVMPQTQVENSQAKLAAFQRCALFSDLKLQLSTRMTPATLRFSLPLYNPATGRTVTIESPHSNPFIAITNESQWFDAAGKLALTHAFEDASEIAFAKFANILHVHFLAATRQDFCRPIRSLNSSDWSYIHSNFFDSIHTIHQSQAHTFWQFFGRVLATLRFKRHVMSLWSTGLIFGFIKKETCNLHLATQELGSFLVRFSESSPGLFAVAYVSDDPNERIKHYLVKSEDISLNKTLPDLIHEKPQFQHVLQLDVKSGVINRYPRDVVFSAYYSKTRKSITTSGSGYVFL